MKTLFTFILALFFIACSSGPPATLPEVWEYYPGKWISFKNDFELEWDYHNTDIEKFEVDRIKISLQDTDIQKIEKLLKKQDIDGLVAIETQLKKRLHVRQKTVAFKPVEETIFKDTKKPTPVYGDFCFYQVRALRGSDSSDPVQLSVILLSKK